MRICISKVGRKFNGETGFNWIARLAVRLWKTSLVFDGRRFVFPTTEGSNPGKHFVAMQLQTFHNAEGVATARKMLVEILSSGSLQGRTSPGTSRAKARSYFNTFDFIAPHSLGY